MAERVARDAAAMHERRRRLVADAIPRLPQSAAEVDVLEPGRMETLVQPAEAVEHVGADHQAGRRRLLDVGR